MLTRERLVGIAASGALMVGIYFANASTPPEVKLGLLYLVPLLMVTWYAGIWAGVVFTAVAMGLRMMIELQQQPTASTTIALLNQLSFAVVAGIAMLAYRRLRRSQEELARLATQDQLTNVLNARSFAERLSQELDRNRRYPRPLALLYMDLDNFKTINDTHGHQTGDAVLRLVADAMRSSVRQSDVVGRLGGDEFAVLMPETEAPLADAAAKRLASSLRNVFKGTPNVTASIGVVSCAATDASTDDLLRRADQAMYDAKKQGKDRVVQVAM